MPRRKYKASADDKKGTPRSYRPSVADICKGSPTRNSVNWRPKKKATKIHKKNFKKRRSFSEPDRVPQNAITLFCDGCCFPTNPGKCGWSFVECESGDRCFGGIPHGTNNQAEMTGAIEALKHVIDREIHKQSKPVIVFSDSQYVVRGCMTWLPKWKKNGWRKSGTEGGELKNLDLWQQIADLLEKTDAQFRWVKGHNGNHFNEMCDRLANEGAYKQTRKFLPGQKSRKPIEFTTVDVEFFTMSSFTEDFLVPAESLLF